uniref:Secreted protein n=1 Tax=Aegilops tauschii subsp. strangulata TaxID=200361 RepID=A0A453DP44_AEGTS
YMTIMARSSSLALAVAVLAIVCCFMPRSATAIRVVPDGLHSYSPPAPRPNYSPHAHGQPYTGRPCKQLYGCRTVPEPPPPATSPPTPRRKTMQVVANT